MISQPAQDDGLQLEMPPEAVEDLVDGYVLLFSVEGVGVMIARDGRTHPDSASMLTVAGANDVPVLRLSADQLIDLSFKGRLSIEHRRRRYQIRVWGVESEEDWSDDKD